MFETKSNISAKNFKVLIVDDISENLVIVGNILREKGIQVSIADSGEQVIKSVSYLMPDLILLDVLMPEMDGYEVCKILKSNPKTKDITIIFLTAKSDSDDVIKGFEFGAVDYITKPFNSGELLSRVFTHLELIEAREQLKELNKTKNKFFSIIAHDLKNPFNTLIGFSEYLLKYFDTFDDDEKKEYIKTIRDSSKKTFKLLENLLIWANLQNNKIVINPEEMDLNHIINDVISLLESQAKLKSITLFSEIENNFSVNADHNMVVTVLRNLISNSIKYTDKGGVIKVSAKELINSVEVSVYDTGVGISKDSISELFKIDSNISTYGTAEEKGTGLGLILSKEFVEKNGGEISVESELGKYTIFKFTLPKIIKEEIQNNILKIL